MNHGNSYETTSETAVDGLTGRIEGEGTRDEGLSADALELLKLKTALRTGYSGEHAITLAGLLTGTNAEEIETSAADLIKILRPIAATLPDHAFDPSQGHGIDKPLRAPTFADMLNID